MRAQLAHALRGTAFLGEDDHRVYTGCMSELAIITKSKVWVEDDTGNGRWFFGKPAGSKKRIVHACGASADEHSPGFGAQKMRPAPSRLTCYPLAFATRCGDPAI
jgi:hypothetical protein